MAVRSQDCHLDRSVPFRLRKGTRSGEPALSELSKSNGDLVFRASYAKFGIALSHLRVLARPLSAGLQTFFDHSCITRTIHRVHHGGGNSAWGCRFVDQSIE